MSIIAGFVAGFLLFSLVGMDLDDHTKLMIFIILWVMIFATVIGIIIYYKIKDKDRLYNEVSEDQLNGVIKKKLGKLGADKSLIQVKEKPDQIKIIMINKGFNAVLLVKKEGISMHYEARDDYNTLDERGQEYVSKLLDNRYGGKALLKLSSDELYKEFMDFVNRTM